MRIFYIIAITLTAALPSHASVFGGTCSESKVTSPTSPQLEIDKTFATCNTEANPKWITAYVNRFCKTAQKGNCSAASATLAAIKKKADDKAAADKLNKEMDANLPTTFQTAGCAKEMGAKFNPVWMDAQSANPTARTKINAFLKSLDSCSTVGNENLNAALVTQCTKLRKLKPPYQGICDKAATIAATIKLNKEMSVNLPTTLQTTSCSKEMGEKFNPVWLESQKNNPTAKAFVDSYIKNLKACSKPSNTNMLAALVSKCGTLGALTGQYKEICDTAKKVQVDAAAADKLNKEMSANLPSTMMVGCASGLGNIFNPVWLEANKNNPTAKTGIENYIKRLQGCLTASNTNMLTALVAKCDTLGNLAEPYKGICGKAKNVKIDAEASDKLNKEMAAYLPTTLQATSCSKEMAEKFNPEWMDNQLSVKPANPTTTNAINAYLTKFSNCLTSSNPNLTQAMVGKCQSIQGAQFTNVAKPSFATPQIQTAVNNLCEKAKQAESNVSLDKVLPSMLESNSCSRALAEKFNVATLVESYKRALAGIDRATKANDKVGAQQSLNVQKSIDSYLATFLKCLKNPSNNNLRRATSEKVNVCATPDASLPPMFQNFLIGACEVAKTSTDAATERDDAVAITPSFIGSQGCTREFSDKFNLDLINKYQSADPTQSVAKKSIDAYLKRYEVCLQKNNPELQKATEQKLNCAAGGLEGDSSGFSQNACQLVANANAARQQQEAEKLQLKTQKSQARLAAELGVEVDQLHSAGDTPADLSGAEGSAVAPEAGYVPGAEPAIPAGEIPATGMPNTALPDGVAPAASDAAMASAPTAEAAPMPSDAAKERFRALVAAKKKQKADEEAAASAAKDPNMAPVVNGIPEMAPPAAPMGAASTEINSGAPDAIIDGIDESQPDIELSTLAPTIKSSLLTDYQQQLNELVASRKITPQQAQGALDQLQLGLAS